MPSLDGFEGWRTEKERWVSVSFVWKRQLDLFLSHFNVDYATRTPSRLWMIYNEESYRPFRFIAAATSFLLILGYGWIRFRRNMKDKSTSGPSFLPPTILRTHRNGNSLFDPTIHSTADALFTVRKRKNTRSRLFSKSNTEFADNGDDQNEARDDFFALLESTSPHNPMKRITYYGTRCSSLVYESIVPPPAWQEVSRQIIPPDKHFQLQRYLTLTIAESDGDKNSSNIESSCAMLGIHHTQEYSAERALSLAERRPANIHSSSMQYYADDPTINKQEKDPPIKIPLDQVSMHAPVPVQSAVLQIYVKDSNQHEWMEHTFSSAALAAQFQMDVLALQIMGPVIYNMYQALQLVHQGSIACPSKEFVFHDNEVGSERDETSSTTDENRLAPCGYGVAWDDCVRCLGSEFPSIRLRLEALWWKQASEPCVAGDLAGINGNGNISELSKRTVDCEDTGIGLNDEYVKKRLLLGLVDFIRLFVPRLPDAAVPRNFSSNARVEQMCRWRKRAARASFLVEAYCDARRVVNIGWEMCQPVPDKYWRRRISFDDNTDNLRWDGAAENVYYEATVSRDVLCHVRGRGFTTSQSAALSLTQAFSLVGLHTIRMHVRPDDHDILSKTDPIVAIPSLRALIERFSHLEFFVSCFYAEKQALWHVALFVRSLPEGVDSSFDAAWKGFKDAEPAARDQKLEMIIHLGTSRDCLPLTTRIGLNLNSVAATLPLEKSFPVQRYASGERIPLPTLRVADCGQVTHFGGCLQQKASLLPTNYVAHVATLSSKRARWYGVSMITNLLENPAICNEVLDVSFILAGDDADELPERVLGTYRMVKKTSLVLLPAASALPEHLVDVSGLLNKVHDDTEEKPSWLTVSAKLLPPDTLRALMHCLKRYLAGSEVDQPLVSSLSEDAQDAAPRQFDSNLQVDSSDPIEEALNELIRLIEPVNVAVRKDQLVSSIRAAAAYSMSNVCAEDTEDDLVSVSILQVVRRSDLRRFLVACGCSHASAALRIVNTMAWRGRILPIDSRLCRVELQTGQFFQQGIDKLGHPVFYFRNMCLGPWRKDENAVIASVLYRLERAILDAQAGHGDDANIRFTLVVALGKPHVARRKTKRVHEQDELTEEATSVDDMASAATGSEAGRKDDDGDEPVEDDSKDVSTTAVTTSTATPPMASSFSNPRVEPDEVWSVHSTKRLVRALIRILQEHYPEYLHRAYVVVGHGNTRYTRTVVGGILRLSNYVSTARTRDKVKFLQRYSDLEAYIEPDELIDYCGGRAPIHSSAFDC